MDSKVLIDLWTKSADDSPFDNPAIGYGTAGAITGGGLSLLKSFLNNNGEGAFGRAMRSALLGGTAGAAIGGGAQLMGFETPSIREALPEEGSPAEGIAPALGIGMLSAGGLAGAGEVAKNRASRAALKSEDWRMNTMLNNIPGRPQEPASELLKARIQRLSDRVGQDVMDNKDVLQNLKKRLARSRNSRIAVGSSSSDSHFYQTLLDESKNYGKLRRAFSPKAIGLLSGLTAAGYYGMNQGS